MKKEIKYLRITSQTYGELSNKINEKLVELDISVDSIINVETESDLTPQIIIWYKK